MEYKGLPAVVRYGIAAAAGFVAALVLVFAVLGVRSLTTPSAAEVELTAEAQSETASEMSEETAVDACREAVTPQLKNPDSADFDGETVEQSSNEISWTVTGTVYATNGFGGVVPTTYTCYATWQGDHFNADATLDD